MLPPLEIVARERPIALVSPATSAQRFTAGTSSRFATPRPAPYVTVQAELRHPDHRAARVEVHISSGATRLSGWYEPDDGDVGIDVVDDSLHVTTHRSRRHGRVVWQPTSLALTLTGRHLTLFCLEDDRWVARARVDLAGRVDTHDERWLAQLRLGHRSDSALVTRLHSGGFGHLGLRDLKLVTEADGRPVLHRGEWLLTATSAGPGFFDTAHTSVWRLSPDSSRLTHSADLYFRRPDRAGVFGDHAVHLVRDEGRWLLAASTWGDFDRERNPSVRCVLAETRESPVEGEHVLETRELPLPTDGLKSVGVWDPHLLRDGETWLVGYASARRFFRFHPCLATGPSLDRLSLRAAATDRRATEGVTLLRPEGRRGPLWVLASDGRDNRRDQRGRFPVFDLDLKEIGTLDAPYPSNLPWPTLVPGERGWRMVTFNGQGTGGPLLGYGTHGDVVFLQEVRERRTHRGGAPPVTTEGPALGL
ncbi:hypothetical protein [Nocardioides solisilvae]|uniref:hypothetical protein n=1 Tax=Nocardioides solisilvae TaxID=1542435 RepID=UPI000D74655C|nr:hypothetical protein [Nocardioides solisilvae]